MRLRVLDGNPNMTIAKRSDGAVAAAGGADRQPAKGRLRVLFAPNEICGQMQLLASAFRDRGHDACAVDYGEPHPFSGPNDFNLRLNRRSRPVRLAASLAVATWAAARFDVFHFFYGRSLSPGYLDLPLLKRLGKRIIVHFRGSDIRSERWLSHSVERKFAKASALEEDEFPDRSTAAQVRRMQVWQRHADRILVSIPELLDILPSATVFQQSLDCSRWPAVPQHGRSQANGPVVVGHVASKRQCKGTKYVIAAVEQLRSEGCSVELDIIENVPHHEVRQRVEACDIGIDGLLQGSYGNVAIEMMATGRPVVARLCDWYRAHRIDLPVVNADPNTITDCLRTLVADRSYRLQLGERGPSYIAKYHDVQKHVVQLERLYTAANHN